MFDKYYRNKFIKLITSLKISDNSKALKMLENKKIRIDNDNQLQSLFFDYCVRSNQFDFGVNLKRFEKYGITLEMLLSDEKVINSIEQYYSDRDIFYMAGGYDEFFNAIYTNEKYKNKYRYLFIKSNIYSLFNNYLISSSVDNFDDVVEYYKYFGVEKMDETYMEIIIKRPYIQDKLFEAGLIDTEFVNKMYEYYFEYLKNNSNDYFEYNISKNLTPTSKMGIYYKELSETLGFDSMEFLMEFAKAHKVGLDDKFGEKSYDELFELFMEKNPWLDKEYFDNNYDLIRGAFFDNDGIPTNLSFLNSYGSMLHDTLYLNYEGSYNWGKLYHKDKDYILKDDEISELLFLYYNKDKISIKRYQKIIEMWYELYSIEDKELALKISSQFILFVTDGHYIHEEHALVDENGITNKFAENLYARILVYNHDKELLTFFDNKYHFEKGSKVRMAINLLEKVGLRSNDLEDHNSLSNWLEKYIDDNGYFNNSLLWQLYNSNSFDKILKIKSYVNNYNFEKSEENVLKLFESGIDKNLIIDIKKFVDENGINGEAVKYLFSNSKFYQVIDIKDYIHDYEYTDVELKCFDICESLGSLKEKFAEFISDKMDKLTVDKIDEIASVLFKIKNSNSEEIRHLSYTLAKQLLEYDDIVERYDKVEQIFIKNNLPYVAKIFKVFKILNSNYKLQYNSSPTLLKYSDTRRDRIIFTDLLKCAIESNNRNLKEYLKSLKDGNNIYLNVINNNISYDELTDSMKHILHIYISHLKMLYSETLNHQNINFNDNDIEDINILKEHLNTNNLPDMIVRMFTHFAGFDSIKEIEDYMDLILKETDSKNRQAANHVFNLENGDLVKGIGDIQYLSNILNNGSVAREFLGSSAGSDGTPLDTDLSMIFDNPSSIKDGIDKVDARCYGPIWLVIKKSDKLLTTRKSNNDNANLENDNVFFKYELFQTGFLGDSHYGIRTGFPSSLIDYIVVDVYDNRIGLDIAMNGFYIPVVNGQGQLLFSPNDYDRIRQKMSGLSYYNEYNYDLSNNLHIPNFDDIIGVDEIIQTLDDNEKDIKNKREAIESAIASSIYPIRLKNKMNGDLTRGTVELLDTGSTGRGTNVPNDADFDFMMRVDQDIMINNDKLRELRNKIINSFGGTDSCVVGNDIRELETDIIINGQKVHVTIDITFIVKTNKMSYATENCVQDRLNSISKTGELNTVLANIIYAKKFLKKFGAYKPARKDATQGGMGGVGIENWILQNGGSFLDAVTSFMETANKCKDFDEFKTKYRVDDFGNNHMNKGNYPHDNFIFNMNKVGYDKMVDAFMKYLRYINNYDSTFNKSSTL